MNQPFKTCPICGQRCVLDMKTCQRCNYGYPTPPQPYYTPQLPYFERQDPVNVVAIATMWVSTAVAFFLFTSLAIGLGLIVDGIALICAIVLVNTKNRTNRINGWVKISLEAISFAIGFLIGSGAFRGY